MRKDSDTLQEVTIKTATSLRATLSIAAGTVLGAASLALTAADPVWNWLHVPTEIRASLGLGISVFWLLVGFLFALNSQQASTARALHDDLATLAEEARRSIPSVTLFTVYTGEEAFHRISNLLHHATVALNTRIFQDIYNPDDNPGFHRWDSEVRAAIQRGLSFREVVSKGNTELAQARRDSAVGAKGQYHAAILDYPLPSFANFTVFHFPDMTKEVWFGWLISRGSGFEGSVVRTTESHVVEFFEQWHRDLYAYGTALEFAPKPVVGKP